MDGCCYTCPFLSHQGTPRTGRTNTIWQQVCCAVPIHVLSCLLPITKCCATLAKQTVCLWEGRPPVQGVPQASELLSPAELSHCNPPLAWTVMLYVRDHCPLPQVTLQAPHWPQAPSQSTLSAARGWGVPSGTQQRRVVHHMDTSHGHITWTHHTCTEHGPAMKTEICHLYPAGMAIPFSIRGQQAKRSISEAAQQTEGQAVVYTRYICARKMGTTLHWHWLCMSP